ncbi:MAG TPA: tannase/feruloyl esterase family alpha/beta hydrolase [Bryobacteraceae bacterium]|nr:tannase/feruloyl esterase family alpha/beta hydrolase [Bryobacteraceae bacterium]
MRAKLSYLGVAIGCAAFAQTPCEQLRSMKWTGTEITAAEPIAAGPLQSPDTRLAAAGQNLPPYCRVAATLRPSTDSDIRMEIWLPAKEVWNGKFEAIGGGGWVGAISYPGMASALRDGYATASTDTGHQGRSASFALGHPEKVVDFSHRAVHEMTVKAKLIIAAYYGRGPRLSYWNGCSTGGRQGLIAAQKYPEDFDGIVAGAPANNFTRLCAWRLALEAAVLKDPAKVVPPAKTSMLNKAVLAACDALDGVSDGLLNDPRNCHFDPSTLLCRDGNSQDCLTAPQVEAVRMAYAPIRNKAGELIYPGLVRGGEAGWVALAGGVPEPQPLNVDMFRYVAHEDPKWDWRTFDVERDTAVADQKAGYMNAMDPDLSAFKKRGGKLLIYHGWNDGASGGAISPLNSVNYYSSVLAKMGAKQENWLRLFLVPGMAHCGGGPGPNQFNALAVMERWRESGTAPEQILASHVTNNRVDMTRPLCPYPKVAVYSGTGDINDAGNFACKVP